MYRYESQPDRVTQKTAQHKSIGVVVANDYCWYKFYHLEYSPKREKKYSLSHIHTHSQTNTHTHMHMYIQSLLLVYDAHANNKSLQYTVRELTILFLLCVYIVPYTNELSRTSPPKWEITYKSVSFHLNILYLLVCLDSTVWDSMSLHHVVVVSSSSIHLFLLEGGQQRRKLSRVHIWSSQMKSS